MKCVYSFTLSRTLSITLILFHSDLFTHSLSLFSLPLFYSFPLSLLHAFPLSLSFTHSHFLTHTHKRLLPHFLAGGYKRKGHSQNIALVTRAATNNKTVFFIVLTWRKNNSTVLSSYTEYKCKRHMLMHDVE